MDSVGAWVAMVAVVGATTLASCGKSSQLDAKKTDGLFTEVELPTNAGLSGLAADSQGRILTVAERAERAFRITLDARLAPTVEKFVVTGVPSGIDLEGIEELGNDHFAFGTEGRDDTTATVLLGELKRSEIAITSTITLTGEQIGIPIPMARNHGAEGICGAGDSLIVAIEGAGEEAGKRWAPVLRIEKGVVVRTHQVWLTSKTGKISGLDCEIAADGTAEVWAIERHFEVTKILAFTLPPTAGDITPRVALDIGAVIDSKRNLEGIAMLRDGRIVTVADNQWKTVDGPSTLQVFGPGVVK